MSKKITLQISIETRERLKKLGRKDETYDEIINRLIDSKMEQLKNTHYCTRFQREVTFADCEFCPIKDCNQ